MKISVALCTFNAAAFLQQQLDSLFAQSCKIDELIICDNHSSDATIQIIKEYEKLYPGIIHLFQNPINMGFNRNFEKAISLTSGDFIFTSDADDIWLPHKIETILKKFDAYPAAYLIFSDAHLIDANNNPIPGSLWQKWNFLKEDRELWQDNKYAYTQLKINNNKISGPTLGFKKSLKDGLFPFNFENGLCFDAYLALCAAKRNGLYSLDEPLIKYRVHQNQQIGIGNGVYLQQMKSSVNNSWSIRWHRRFTNLWNKSYQLFHSRHSL